MQELEPRMLLSATLVNDVPDQFVQASGGVIAIDLDDYFEDTDLSGTLVKFDTSFGDIYVHLFDDVTPATVQNFLSYVNSEAYDGSFFHRSVEDFIVQGGGFTYGGEATYDAITSDAPVDNEPGITNGRGTIAMAKIDGDPDSATNQWFFNLADNADTLDDQNGGFTVFGQVVGGTMDVVDDIAETPIWNASSIHGAFGELPLRDFTNDHYPNENDLVMVDSVRVADKLSYSVVSISDPLVGTSFDDDGNLVITSLPTGVTGTITITVEAEDIDGNTTQTTFDLIVGDGQNSMTGDGHADLLWRDFKSGNNDLWRVVNQEVLEMMDIEKVGSKTWYVAGVADFNQDGKNDMFWRNTFTGQNMIWMMDGDTVTSAVEIQTLDNQNWVIGGFGDFNGDQKTDVFWHNTRNGRNTIWQMDGTALADTTGMRKQNGAWEAVGVGDFNRDGGSDILWRNTNNGKNQVWFLDRTDGSFIDSDPLLRVNNTNWEVVSVGDFNIDGQLDILWRHARNNNMVLWHMNGIQQTDTSRLNEMKRGNKWRLAGRDSYQASMQKSLAKVNRIEQRAKAQNISYLTALNDAKTDYVASVLDSLEPILSLDGDDDDA